MTDLKTTPLLPKRSADSNLSTISLRLPPSDNEVQAMAERLLDDHPIPGPIYHYINKRLACVCINENQHELAVYHLTEGHGCTLRHQALYRYDKIALKETSTVEEADLGQNLKQIIALDGKYTLQKYEGLQRRLRELPSEWTIVQLTVQYDPLLRITHQPIKHHPIHLTRMSCGDLANKMSADKQGGQPISVLVSPDCDSSGVVPIVRTIIEDLQSNKRIRSANPAINISAEFSDKLKSLIMEFEGLLEDTNSILPGNLIDSKLHKTICAKVDKIVKSFANTNEISKSQLQVLYLLATSPVRLQSKESKILKSTIGKSSWASDLYKAVTKLHEEYHNVLSTAARHPVIIILDEFLDIFPIESVNVLKNNPVSRVPSVHFAHALYREHAHSIFRSGINGENGFYIVNPSGDLTACEKIFRQLLSSVAPKWEGLFGVAPTESQYIDALTKYSIFLYCGHGGGNQYADAVNVERHRTQAVLFLMGCSSTQIVALGGRVDGHSLFNSYMIGGCPCTVGMLWDVTDSDANRMTEYILKRWRNPDKSNKSDSVDNVCKTVKNLNLQDDDLTAEPDLLRLVSQARSKGKHLRNTAALVVRGLPVKIKWM